MWWIITQDGGRQRPRGRADSARRKTRKPGAEDPRELTRRRTAGLAERYRARAGWVWAQGCRHRRGRGRSEDRRVPSSASSSLTPATRGLTGRKPGQCTAANMTASDVASLGREFLDDAALPRNEDAVGQAQDLRQVGRDDDDREPFVGERGDQMVDFGDGADVDAARRLVEDDQLGFLDQRLGDDHLLLIAAGKLDDPSVAVQRPDVELLRPVGGERAHLAHARRRFRATARLEICPM